MDFSAEMGPIFLNYYQTQIVVLIWMVELGRIDIITKVYILASQLAVSREGCLEAVFNIFGYLKGRHNAQMVFDPTYLNPYIPMFHNHDWCGFHGDVKKSITFNAPEIRDKEVDLRIFVGNIELDTLSS